MGRKYLGDGEFIVADGGVIVPARNLTDDEAKEFAKPIKANFKATGRQLYADDPNDAKPADPAKE